MKNIFKQYISRFAAFVFALSFIVSCGTDDLDIATSAGDEEMNYTYKMVLNGGLQSFDDAVNRSATATWENNDSVYLVFVDADGVVVKGWAVYNSSLEIWTVSASRAISDVVSSTCNVYYFDSKTAAKNDVITLSASSVVYAATAATYSKNGEYIEVNATLSPQTGRVRFKGDAGDSFTISGFDYFSQFNHAEGSLITSAFQGNVTIGEDGFSPFYYGVFSGSTRYLELRRGSNEYKTICKEAVLAPGKSGYYNVPDSENLYGWTLERNEATPSKLHVGCYVGQTYTSIQTEINADTEYTDYCRMDLTPGESENECNFNIYNLNILGIDIDNINISRLGLIPQGDDNYLFAEKAPIDVLFGSTTVAVSINADKSYIKGDSIVVYVDGTIKNLGNMPCHILFKGDKVMPALGITQNITGNLYVDGIRMNTTQKLNISKSALGYCSYDMTFEDITIGTQEFGDFVFSTTAIGYLDNSIIIANAKNIKISNEWTVSLRSAACTWLHDVLTLEFDVLDASDKILHTIKFVGSATTPEKDVNATSILNY